MIGYKNKIPRNKRNMFAIVQLKKIITLRNTVKDLNKWRLQCL